MRKRSILKTVQFTRMKMLIFEDFAIYRQKRSVLKISQIIDKKRSISKHSRCFNEKRSVCLCLLEIHSPLNSTQDLSRNEHESSSLPNHKWQITEYSYTTNAYFPISKARKGKFIGQRIHATRFLFRFRIAWCVNLIGKNKYEFLCCEIAME